MALTTVLNTENQWPWTMSSVSSERERSFSAGHADDFELHVVWGIDLDQRMHAGSSRYRVRSDQTAMGSCHGNAGQTPAI